jgi:hypothetical protein
VGKSDNDDDGDFGSGQDDDDDEEDDNAAHDLTEYPCDDDDDGEASHARAKFCRRCGHDVKTRTRNMERTNFIMPGNVVGSSGVGAGYPPSVLLLLFLDGAAVSSCCCGSRRRRHMGDVRISTTPRVVIDVVPWKGKVREEEDEKQEGRQVEKMVKKCQKMLR